jgi:hypothetical protein
LPPSSSILVAALCSNICTPDLGRLGEAERIVQRMQMPAAGILDAAEIELAGDLAADGVAVEQLRLGVVHLALVGGDLLLHPGNVAGLGGEQHVAGPQVAGDAVLLDPLPDDGARLLGEIEERLAALLAEPRDQLLRRLAQARVDLPAIAPRCTPADAIGLDQRHLVSALGEIERGAQTSEPAAHDADIDADRLRQPRPGAMRIRGRGVVGTRRMFLVGKHAALALNARQHKERFDGPQAASKGGGVTVLNRLETAQA